MERATERRPELGKGTSVKPRKVCFFRSNLRGSRLKDAVTKQKRHGYRSIDVEQHYVETGTEGCASCLCYPRGK